ncbi:MAG: vWA domain-containing protein, partial [Candidatus Melainabacteria bacterium]|nr:vWA domain-containing protein [Candidatus Melainabacteria bacterium]
SEDDPDIRSRTYNFPNLAVLVEASRGNLDSTANRNGTGLHRGYVLNAGSFANTNTYQGANLNMNPQTGYQKAYQRMAMWYSQPIATSLDGADQGFFQKLSALCDCRFGFVGFSDSDPFQGTIPNLNSVATPHTGVWGGAQGTATYCGKNSYYYDVNFQQAATLGRLVWDGRHSAGSGGSGTLQRNHENNDTQAPSGLPGFRIPRTPLNTGISQTQSLNIITKGASATTIPWSDPNSGDGLYNGRPQSGTMCYEAMETARRHFQNALYDGLSRAGSKRSIVFFTDGIPSGGVASTEATQTQGVADQCKNDGIAIYSIGLNMTGNPSLTADQNTFLGNGSAGLSGRAKNGGRYFECGSVDEVKQAFSAIARRLTQSQR